ncbi:hypothetical protein BKA62DRAFT_813891 [Auriculariales sp. MPI-PUGE-AT-0066]|nr:hypothetical protein BKA62DRAFT_813891 [Auriculariales sp. MPI-PUGE-AT-0066]
MLQRTVLITGCSEGGLGAALARAFQARGFHVFATVRNANKAGALGDVENIEVLNLDVKSEDSIQQCVREVEQRTGGTLDVLVNNAGADFVMPLLDTQIEQAKALYDLNVWGVLATTQAFVPMLIKAKGTIVDICSVGAVLPMAWSGIYNSSKAANNFLSETLRLEIEPLGVRVITVMAGGIETPIHENAGKLELPLSSYYQAAQGHISDQRSGAKKPGAQRPEVTARNIVHDVVNGRRGQIWRGGNASTIWWLVWLLPKGAVEWMLNKGVDRGLALVTA